MKRELFYAFLVLLSVVAGWILSGFLLGATFVWQIVGALTALFWIAAVSIAVRRVPARGRVAAGLVMIGLLFLPAAFFIEGFPGGATAPFGPPLTFTVVAILAVAIAIVALLFHEGVTSRSAIPIGQADVAHVALLPLAVGGLLLAMILHTLYWLMVWDSTYDPIGALLITFLVVITVLAGAVLVIALTGRTRIAGGLFMLLVPLSLILVTVFAQRSDFRRITALRAERVSRALETYHAREGDYPATLPQLTPRDAMYLAGPVIMFGQGWCYDTDGASYRLGYVDRDHWSDPRLIGRVHASTGNSAESQATCANEIDRLIAQYPDFFVRRAD